jgi:hypothetical protein
MDDIEEQSAKEKKCGDCTEDDAVGKNKPACVRFG